jgi:DNA-binding transcriptional ArsR family regulator
VPTKPGWARNRFRIRLPAIPCPLRRQKPAPGRVTMASAWTICGYAQARTAPGAPIREMQRRLTRPIRYIILQLYNAWCNMSNLDAAFSAMADPTRRGILARLAVGEATVMELAAPFDMTQPAISRHLKVLEGAGLIVRRVDGTKRPCRLAPSAITEIDQWLDVLRQALTRNYDRLDDVLAGMKPKKRRTRR